MKALLVRTLDQWRDWLTEHHASESEVWLIFHKGYNAGCEKGFTHQPSIDYKDALDEALCFGWRLKEAIRLLASGKVLGLK